MSDRWRFPVPRELAEFTGVCDSVVLPKVFLTAGLDANLLRNAKEVSLELNVDPRQVFRTTLNNAGAERLLIWLYMPGFDRFDLAKRFGVLFGAYLPSTPAFHSAVKR